MGKPRKTKEQFIKESIAVHGDKYDYSKVNYISSSKKVKLICSYHGEFSVTPSNHLSRKIGCKKCSTINRGKTKSQNFFKEFKAKANLVHNNFYSYDKVNYVDSKTKIIITCPRHEDFEVRPSSHLQGIGCYHCGREKTIAGKKISKQDFINKASRIHNNKYDYSNIDFKNVRNKIKIICPDHGEFEQIARNHYYHGCPKCGDIKRRYKTNCYSYSGWEKQGRQSKHFYAFQLYQIKCWNEEEEFYKIGRTFVNIQKRFKNKYCMPYNYKVIDCIELTPKTVCQIENLVKNSQERYVPKLNFGGKYECLKKKVNLQVFINKKNL